MWEPKFLQKGKIAKIKRYFRYHHFNTTPIKASHKKYIRLVDEFVETHLEGTDKEIWLIILSEINSLSFDQIEDVYIKIISK